MVKNIIIIVMSLGYVAIILAVILHHRRAADGAGELNKNIEDGKRNIADTTSRIDESAKNVGNELSKTERLLQEIRNQTVPDNRDYSL